MRGRERQKVHSPLHVRRIFYGTAYSRFLSSAVSILKIRNHESQFLLPFSERRNCESKNESFSIHFTILFWPTILESIPEKRPKTVKESELQFFWNQNRHSPTPSQARVQLSRHSMRSGQESSGAANKEFTYRGQSV